MALQKFIDDDIKGIMHDQNAYKVQLENAEKNIILLGVMKDSSTAEVTQQYNALQPKAVEYREYLKQKLVVQTDVGNSSSTLA